MFMLRGLGDVDYGDCITKCDAINPYNYLDASGNLTDDYAKAYGACATACMTGAESGYGVPRPTTSIPSSVVPVTSLPDSLKPPPGYQANVPTNWWRYGSVAIGFVLGGLTFFAVRGIRHAA